MFDHRSFKGGKEKQTGGKKFPPVFLAELSALTWRLAIAVFAASAFLAVIHRAIFAGRFAALFFRRKCARANHRCEDRHQNFRVILHGITLVRDVTRR